MLWRLSDMYTYLPLTSRNIWNTEFMLMFWSLSDMYIYLLQSSCYSIILRLDLLCQVHSFPKSLVISFRLDSSSCFGAWMKESMIRYRVLGGAAESCPNKAIHWANFSSQLRLTRANLEVNEAGIGREVCSVVFRGESSKREKQTYAPGWVSLASALNERCTWNAFLVPQITTKYISTSNCKFCLL